MLRAPCSVNRNKLTYLLIVFPLLTWFVFPVTLFVRSALCRVPCLSARRILREALLVLPKAITTMAHRAIKGWLATLLFLVFVHDATHSRTGVDGGGEPGTGLCKRRLRFCP